ncbi:MAG TPA: hypothetical protein VHS29_14840 [Candidatus Acidoferrales bacterium]|nr:hypothetical protein [Candidatus Acidoferrales bacterium]
MGLKILSSMMAVLGSAALTLACVLALVQGTIYAVSLEQTALRFIAIAAVFLVGTSALIGCIYLATHLAVRFVGVGQPDFPPVDTYSSKVSSGDSPKI